MENNNFTVPQIVIEDTDSTSSSDSEIEGGTVPTGKYIYLYNLIHNSVIRKLTVRLSYDK